MSKNKLILLSREGCCLCEGLEERLKSISFEKINPSLKLYVVNIDEGEVPKALRDRYSLEVPVLLLEVDNPLRRIQLPRVSPRLSGESLLSWLRKVIQKNL